VKQAGAQPPYTATALTWAISPVIENAEGGQFVEGLLAISLVAI